MKREELEHLIRAAGAVAGVRQLVIIGSQAILASHPQAPPELLASLEADTYPPDEPEKAELIDGSIGELSPFHEQFGYYAHGVGPETATLPRNWRQRLVALVNDNTGGVTGLCLGPVDLAISKLLAGREKDLDFVAAMVRHALVSEIEIANLGGELTASDAERLVANLKRCLRRVQS